jgi:hypothetical protein
MFDCQVVKVSFSCLYAKTNILIKLLFTLYLNTSLYVCKDHVRWVPLSPQHGASSGCGWKGWPPVGG